MKLIKVLTAFLFCINCLQAQTYFIPKTPILDTLLRVSGPVSEISTVEGFSLLPISINRELRPQTLVKTQKGLFVLVDGSGMVFKANLLDSNLISFTRIDSTFYSGYNFGAINFSYHDTLFSFGGNGFWTTNGHLRYLGDGNEWDAVELNEIYPTARYIYDYLPDQSKLHFIQLIVNKKYANYNKEDYGAVELDLSTKNIRLLGKLNPNLIPGFSRLVHINVPSLNGTLVFNKDQIYLYRFIDNSVYKFKKTLNSNKFYFGENAGVNINFEHKGIIYYSKNNDSSVRSFKLNLSDFEKTRERLYIPIEKEGKQYYYLVGLLFLLGLVIFLFFYFKRRAISHSEITVLQDNISTTNDFNDFEINIVKKIISKQPKMKLSQ